MLESTTCSLEYKWIVLHAICKCFFSECIYFKHFLAKILTNPQSVVDIFVNYDCDLTSHNVFAALVEALSKTARTPITEHAPPQQKEQSVVIHYS